MLSKNDFLRIISYRETRKEIPAISNLLKTIAWQEFINRRETDDIIANAYTEDSIYDREMDIADEIINEMVKKQTEKNRIQ